MKRYASFAEFYPYYLSEHQNPACRQLHYLGSFLVLVLVALILVTRNWVFLPVLLVAGYGPAWIGHFFFEKNRPATFHYPFWSFVGDWVMFWEFLKTGIKKS